MLGIKVTTSFWFFSFFFVFFFFSLPSLSGFLGSPAGEPPGHDLAPAALHHQPHLEAPVSAPGASRATRTEFLAGKAREGWTHGWIWGSHPASPPGHVAG